MRGENSNEGSGPLQGAFLQGLDLSTIADERARECIARLLNLVETLVAETHQLRAENQRLRDEVSRLKGQQGKPNIPPNRPAKTGTSSEQERREPKTSFTDCISSLADLSSSLEVSSSSLVVWRYSSLARSSCFSVAMRTSTLAAFSSALSPASKVVAFSDRPWPAAGASSKMTRNSLAAASESGPPDTGWTVRLTISKSPLVLIRRPGWRIGSLSDTALCRAVVKSSRNPARAIVRMFMPASPGAGSRYLPVRPRS